MPIAGGNDMKPTLPCYRIDTSDDLSFLLQICAVLLTRLRQRGNPTLRGVVAQLLLNRLAFPDALED